MTLRSLIPLLHRHLTTSAPHHPPKPVDPSQLLLVCTALFQLQNHPDSKLHSRLRAIGFDLSHEFFLQVCNRFPLSWKPVLRFYRYTLQDPAAPFAHTPVSVNKVLGVIAKGRNVPLMWNFLREASETKLANRGTYLLASKAFAEGRQLKKCVQLFDLIRSNNIELYNLDMLNRVVGLLCEERLVGEAMVVTRKVKPVIVPDSLTYGCLVVGFCRAGDLVQASKVWNLILDEGIEPPMEAYEEFMVTFFKNNRSEDALKVFKSMRDGEKIRELGLSTYSAVITWMCKRGRIEMSMMVLAEMVKRGVDADGPTLGALVYGLIVRRKVREGYKVLDEIHNPDINVYHGLIRGLLRLRRAGDATQVFRQMCSRGCEPIMHTYIMLLQGHLGKKGRKGKDQLVNFDSIFVGGLVKAGKFLQATKYVERMIWTGTEVPKFDYNKFLQSFSDEEGLVMFEEVGKRLMGVGMVDLGDIFLRYGEKMATRDRRRRLPEGINVPESFS